MREPYQDPRVLSDFIRKEIDLLCISVGWRSRFEQVCDFIAQLPQEVTTIVGGYQATLEVETCSSGARTSLRSCGARARRSSSRS